ncbi:MULTISPECIES: hypothetical protein [Streptomyces]|uniref:Uncharacterized protein n=1 Tax=Streptomyces ramulosus TaxID=47762 RepID=A0ABW1FF28_9ACTN
MSQLILTLATVGALGLPALPATAAPPPPAMAAPAAAASWQCIGWSDNAGPGHAYRYHAKCAGSGLYVQARIRCYDGTTVYSAWRYEYAKAECPYGVRDASWSTFDVRKKP